MLDAIFWFLGLLILFHFIRILLKAKSPFKKATLSMLTGAFALISASVLAELFGAYLAVNIYTVFIALTLGIPGVVLIIMKMFFI